MDSKYYLANGYVVDVETTGFEGDDQHAAQRAAAFDTIEDPTDE